MHTLQHETKSEGYFVAFDFSKEKLIADPRWLEVKGKRVFEAGV